MHEFSRKSSFSQLRTTQFTRQDKKTLLLSLEEIKTNDSPIFC